MGERINHKNIKKKIPSLADIIWPDISLTKSLNPQGKNPQIYRCVLGCSLNGNSTSRSCRDVKLIKKEESKSLVLERR